MAVLLDSNILIPMLAREEDTLPDGVLRLLADPAVVRFASVASLWEMAIKVRLGKLRLGMNAEDLPAAVRSFNLATLEISAAHAVADITPDVNTRDPFDRLLLAQCAVEGMRLVTVDRALAGHPYAWR